jgi:hypothetical protein
MKGGMTTWFETYACSGGADTEISLYDDEDALLGRDDDSGEGLCSRFSARRSADTWVTVHIRNRGQSWGSSSSYSFRIVTAAEATPTVTPTSTPYILPTPTQYKPPTPKPYPTPRPPVVIPTSTPKLYPTPTRKATATPLFSGKTPTPLPITPPVLPQTPTVTGTVVTVTVRSPLGMTSTPTPTHIITKTRLIRVQVYIDENKNSQLDPGEGVDNLLALAFVEKGKKWQSSGSTEDGKVDISIPEMKKGTEVEVKIPYLHRSGVFKFPKEGDIDVEIRLVMPRYPVYLP